MTVTAKEVNELRTKTGAGLMDCKKALIEANGDFEKAIEILRKKGQKISASRQDREAKEGAIFAITNADNTLAYAIELNCETDFVARTDDFTNLGNLIVKLALEKNAQSLEQLLALTTSDNLTVQQKLEEAMAKIGEKIEISKFQSLQGEYIYAHLHTGGRIAVLLSMQGTKEVAKDKLAQVAKDVCMQITAMNPIAVDKNSVNHEIIQKEIEIGKEQARQEGKPENILEKIALGKLEKFFKENTLLAQEFVKDNSKTIEQLLKEYHKNLTVVAFNRLELGAKS